MPHDDDAHDDDADFEPPPNPVLDAIFAAEDAVAAHYARQQEGLPPPIPSYGKYATFQEAWVTHRRWLASQPIAPTPVALPDPPPEE